MSRPASPSTHRTDAEWQRWGEIDPYYGVITDERYRRDNLTPERLAEFFQTGRLHLARLLKICHRYVQPKFVPQRALDFGCGVGRVLVAMAERFPEAVGVDVSAAMRAEAQRNCDERGLKNVLILPSDDHLSAVQGSFDLIHSVIVFQHIDPVRGHALVARLVDRLRPGGVGVLHFTYARTLYADRYGQLPPPAPPTAEPPRKRWRLAPAPTPAPAPPPGDDPEMQMNPYPLNEILFSVQRCGARRCHVEFTDHGGEWGLVVYFQRPAT